MVVGRMPTNCLGPVVTLAPDDETVPMRRRLRQRLKVWESAYGQNSWVARVVLKGVTLIYRSSPTSYRSTKEVTDERQRSVISQEITDMLSRGVISQAQPRRQQIVSRIFCVTKKGTDKLRPCLDLRPLNRHLDPPKFKLEGLPVLRNLVQPQDFCCSVDLSSAYWHIPLSKKVKQWFRFEWEGQTYEFEVLPFGVSVAPWIFWRILKPWASSLRAQGVRLTVYLDDILVLGASKEECVCHTQMVTDSLQALGFCLNQKKSVLVPSRRATFLGFELDTSQMTFSLPAEKVRRIARSCRRLANFAQARKFRSLRELSRVLGQITAAGDALLAHRRRSVSLEKCRAIALRQGLTWDQSCTLTQEAICELRWWAANLKHCPGRPVRLPPPSVVITTDASALGWGGYISACLFDKTLVGRSFGGRLPDGLVNKVSNETELYAIQQSVRTLARMVSLRGKHVRIRTDNTAAMFYVNKGGGRSLALSRGARPLWDTCSRRGISLSAEHLPGDLNDRADAISRRAMTPADWRLKRQYFKWLTNEFRFHPTIDAFAEPSNTLVKRFASRYPVPGSVRVSGLELEFAKERAFCFPPPRLVGRLLSVLRDQRAVALVVVPHNRGAYWWPSLRAGSLRMATSAAVDVLRRQSGMAWCSGLRMTAALFCGGSWKMEDILHH